MKHICVSIPMISSMTLGIWSTLVQHSEAAKYFTETPVPKTVDLSQQFYRHLRVSNQQNLICGALNSPNSYDEEASPAFRLHYTQVIEN